MKLLAVVVTVIVLAGCSQPEPPTMAEIKSSCDQQFGAESAASAECQLRIVSKLVEDDQSRRMQAAEDAVR